MEMETTTLLSSSSSDDEKSEISSFSMPSSSSTQIELEVRNDRAKKYDVFINFRGEDTRKNILGHLREALSEKGIKTFVDDDQMERGQYISPQLVEAIEESRCAIVIISPNYATSTWCLDELIMILDCMKTGNQVVIPVFYRVEPSHARKQIGSFEEAFEKYESNKLLDLERINRWRDALREITSLAGLDLQNSRDEAHFIKEIVNEVSRKLASFATESSEEFLSKAANGVKRLFIIITFFLFFFLVLFPLFGLLFFKIIVPIFEKITGFDKDPFGSSSSWHT